MGWVGNEGVDINWNISPAVSSPVTMSSHLGDQFDKESRYGLIFFVRQDKKSRGCGEVTVSRGSTVIILLLHFVQ